MACYLAESTYGKDEVRVLRVVREGKINHIVEYNMQVLLEGDLETRQEPLVLLPVVFKREGQLYPSGQQRRCRDIFHEEHHIL